jgi:NADPH:quinone reductase-like Zn-dependent oxidoreductase
MKAIAWTNYGAPDVLELAEVEKPAPKDNEVLIKVYAATVTAGDCEMRRCKFPFWLWLPMRLYMGIFKPRRSVLGQELAGEIDADGSAVTQFKKGDAVFGATLLYSSAYAEYVCLPETQLVIKPANITYEEAATIPTGGINGLHFLRKAHVQGGEKVLINGAGGSIGTYALQIAKSWGAEVTCVDSGAKLDMLRSIGADHVIDYTQEDFTKNSQTYDVIIDVVGKSSFSGSIRSLKQDGRYVLGVLTLPGVIRGLWTSMTSDKKVFFELARYETEAYAVLKDLIQAGKLKVVIDQRYPLEQIAEAHRYVEDGHKKGNVIITVAQDT